MHQRSKQKGWHHKAYSYQTIENTQSCVPSFKNLLTMLPAGAKFTTIIILEFSLPKSIQKWQDRPKLIQEIKQTARYGVTGHAPLSCLMHAIAYNGLHRLRTRCEGVVSLR